MVSSVEYAKTRRKSVNDFPGIHVPFLIDAFEQGAHDGDARRGDVLFDPRLVLEAYCVVMRQCALEVDETLLDGRFHDVVLLELVATVNGFESKREVETGA
jgi:hypothetical protein